MLVGFEMILKHLVSSVNKDDKASVTYRYEDRLLIKTTFYTDVNVNIDSTNLQKKLSVFF